MTTPKSRNPGLDTLRACAIALVFMYHYGLFVDGAEPVRLAGLHRLDRRRPVLRAERLPDRQPAVRRHRPAAGAVAAALLRAPRVAHAAGLLAGAGRVRAVSRRRSAAARRRRGGASSRSRRTSGCSRAPRSRTRGRCAWRSSSTWCCRRSCWRAARAGSRARRVTLTRAHGWALMGALVAVGVVARGVLWQRYGRPADGHGDGYMPWIYYATLCRFDEFIPGRRGGDAEELPSAGLGSPDGARRPLSALGAAAVAAMLTLALSLLRHRRLRLGLLHDGLRLLADRAVVRAAGGRGAEPVGAGPAVAHSGRRPARAVVVLDLPVAQAAGALPRRTSWQPLGDVRTARGSRSSRSPASPWAGCCYRLVEAPFMALRDRLVPSNFRDRHAARAAAGRGQALSP